MIDSVDSRSIVGGIVLEPARSRILVELVQSTTFRGGILDDDGMRMAGGVRWRGE